MLTNPGKELDVLKAIIDYLRPTPQPIPSEHPPHVYREKASFYLYMSVRPVGGLDWHNLSPDQQQRVREIINFAVQLTDATRSLQETR